MAERPERFKKPRKQKNSVLRAVAFATQIGFTMAACVLIGVFLGKYLDERLHTSPWLLLVCSLLGIASAFWSIFSLAKRSGDR